MFLYTLFLRIGRKSWRRSRRRSRSRRRRRRRRRSEDMERRRQEETQEEERVDVSVCSLVPRHKHRCDNFPASPLLS